MLEALCKDVDARLEADDGCLTARRDGARDVAASVPEQDDHVSVVERRLAGEALGFGLWVAPAVQLARADGDHRHAGAGVHGVCGAVRKPLAQSRTGLGRVGEDGVEGGGGGGGGHGARHQCKVRAKRGGAGALTRPGDEERSRVGRKWCRAG